MPVGFSPWSQRWWTGRKMVECYKPGIWKLSSGFCIEMFDVFSRKLRNIENSMVIHDTECPYWNQVSKNSKHLIRMSCIHMGDTGRLLTHTYPHKPLRKIKVTMCRHQVGFLSDLVIIQFTCILESQVVICMQRQECGHTWHWMSSLRPDVIKQCKLKLIRKSWRNKTLRSEFCTHPSVIRQKTQSVKIDFSASEEKNYPCKFSLWKADIMKP